MYTTGQAVPGTENITPQLYYTASAGTNDPLLARFKDSDGVWTANNVDEYIQVDFGAIYVIHRFSFKVKNGSIECTL